MNETNIKKYDIRLILLFFSIKWALKKLVPRALFMRLNRDCMQMNTWHTQITRYYDDTVIYTHPNMTHRSALTDRCLSPGGIHRIFNSRTSDSTSSIKDYNSGLRWVFILVPFLSINNINCSSIFNDWPFEILKAFFCAFNWWKKKKKKEEMDRNVFLIFFQFFSCYIHLFLLGGFKNC